MEPFWRSQFPQAGEAVPQRECALKALLRPHFSFFLRAIRILAAPAAACRSAAFVSDLPKTRVVARCAAMRSCFGYGFIRPSSGDKDVFVHISAVERAGLSTLNEGQTVEYELVTNRGKTSAENLKVS
jgi:CspA family cold shock protein